MVALAAGAWYATANAEGIQGRSSESQVPHGVPSEEEDVRIVLNSKFFHTLSAPELAVKARELGFDGIDINVRPDRPGCGAYGPSERLVNETLE